jgi:hypothetical protein
LKEHDEEIPTEEETLEYTLTVKVPKLPSLTPQKIINMLEKRGWIGLKEAITTTRKRKEESWFIQRYE